MLNFDVIRLGVLGIKVKIMLPHDPKGICGPRTPLPDHIQIVEPKDEQPPATPYSEHKEVKKLDGMPPTGMPPQPLGFQVDL
uniref:Ribosomal protein S3 n=1 Tax=Romanomermis culicivorax TaxID=13658 RepID=A0A915IKQ4_ROMCU